MKMIRIDEITKQDWRATKTFAAVFVFIGFMIGVLIGGILATNIQKSRILDIVEADNQAIWIQIHQIEGDKHDLFQRVDQLARDIKTYNWELIRFKIIEDGQQELDVKFK